MAEAIQVKGLGEVEGLCACYSHKTMNDRPYDKIYQRLLSGEDFRYNEMMRRGGILCEFGHPNQYVADFERTETDPEKACAIITSITQDARTGKVYAKATILDTPAGRIYKAIAPFYKFGFSSRGSYEVDENSTEGPNGWNQDSYVFKGFDIVALPATEGSELSAVESLGTGKKKRKKIKSARESLDLQNIATAANVDPSEVDAELDKIFERDGSIAPAEYIDTRNFSADSVSDTGTKPASSDNDPLLCDIKKVLSDNSKLQGDVQKLMFEKANAESSVISLQEKVSKLQGLLDGANAELEFYINNREEIQQLLDKLLQTYDEQVSKYDTALTQSQEQAKSLASQVAELKQKVSEATDEAASLYSAAEQAKDTAKKLTATQTELATAKKTNASLASQLSSAKEELKSANARISKMAADTDKYKKMAIAARESMAEAYASLYSVDKRALLARVGSSLDAATVRRAAESLSDDTTKLSDFFTARVVPAVEHTSDKTPRYVPHDDVDKELLENLKNEGLIKDELK